MILDGRRTDGHSLKYDVIVCRKHYTALTLGNGQQRNSGEGAISFVLTMAASPNASSGGGIPVNTIILVLTVCCFVTLVFSFLHVFVIQNEVEMQTFHEQHFLTAVQDALQKPSPQHHLKGLLCEKYGGPSPEVAQEMVYWSDIPSDAEYVSPFLSTTETQYMTFEPDGGGWNNIRMSMETVLTMAIAMGRTLVLPPEQRMYLLGDSRGNQQRKEFSFQDFFPMDRIAAENKGLTVITMEEFLKREGITGGLADSATGSISFPPHNRTAWNGQSAEISSQLNPYLRSVAVMPAWDPNKCLAAFPATTAESDLNDLQQIKETVLQKILKYQDYIGNPVNVDGPVLDRMSENWANRKDLCLYDKDLQHAKIVHFHGKRGLGARLLVHFYAFLFFQDWRQDLWMKRFVRDHVRYIDEMQCAAARIVHAVRQRAIEKGTSEDGEFDAFHIRRGDFQYKKTRVEASVIYGRTKDLIPEGTTVYIGTDERKKEFFQPLKDHWDVVFLDDYMHLIKGINTNYYGMLDQLITSRSRKMIGCWHSTFTGYINRIRGYHSDKLRLPGYEDGVIESYYYANEENKMMMREYYPVKQALYVREFPTSWRGIDKGVPDEDGSVDTER